MVVICIVMICRWVEGGLCRLFDTTHIKTQILESNNDVLRKDADRKTSDVWVVELSDFGREETRFMLWL